MIAYLKNEIEKKLNVEGSDVKMLLENELLNYKFQEHPKGNLNKLIQLTTNYTQGNLAEFLISLAKMIMWIYGDNIFGKYPMEVVIAETIKGYISIIYLDMVVTEYNKTVDVSKQRQLSWGISPDLASGFKLSNYTSKYVDIIYIEMEPFAFNDWYTLLEVNLTEKSAMGQKCTLKHSLINKNNYKTEKEELIGYNILLQDISKSKISSIEFK